MQLHRQLPKLREGGAGRGEDLSNLGAEQHYGGPAARRPTPASDPPAPRPARTSREPGRGPTLRGRQGAQSAREVEPWWTLTSWPRAPPHGDAPPPPPRELETTESRAAGRSGSRAGSPALLAADWLRPDLTPVTQVASQRGGRRGGRRRSTSGWLHSTSVGGSGLLVEAGLSPSSPGPPPSLKAQTPSLGEPLLFIVVQNRARSPPVPSRGWAAVLQGQG